MARAKVATELPELVWMDKARNLVKGEHRYERMCTHKIDHPECVVVADKVGGNTNMTDNGHKGGEKLWLRKAQFRNNHQQQKTYTLMC